MTPQKPPQRIEALDKSASKATFIFLHGYGDTADGFTSKRRRYTNAIP